MSATARPPEGSASVLPPAGATPARRRRAAKTIKLAKADQHAASAAVIQFDRSRISKALQARTRYKYVQPRVEAEGAGWKIVSPNCSRNIDSAGGDINIAWLLPSGDGRWSLHAHDHAQQRWHLKAGGLTLAQALAIVNDDSTRTYWP